MAEQDEDMAEVIELRPGEEKIDQEAPLRVRPSEGRRCSHYQGRYSLDRSAQRAYCQECDGEVPLFEVLDHFARDFDRHVYARKHAKELADQLEARVRELERVERNAKSRIRSALKRAPECECAPGPRHRYSPGPWCSVCGGVRREA